MKVKYVGETCSFTFTNGKVYEVLSVEKGYFRIVDETGEDYLYHPSLFEVVK